MLEMPIEPFLDAFVQMYHLLSILSALQFRIIRFVLDHGAAKSCCCKLVSKHKESPMILASDLSDSLIACRDHLLPAYLEDLSEKARLPIVKSDLFKYAKSSALNLFYSLQDQRYELSIIFENLTDVVDILQKSDPSLMLWDEFKTIIPMKLDLIVSNLSLIMVAFEVPLKPLPLVQLGHHVFLEMGRDIFKKRCQKLNESMFKVHRKGYHSHH